MALFALFGFNPQALAAADTWVGNTSASWNASNWSGTNNPPLTGDSLVFGVAGTSGLTLTDNLMTPSTFALGGITFNSGASAFVINPAGASGFTLNSASSIVNHGANTETINDLIALTGTDTFTTDTTGGALTFGGVISNSTGVTGVIINGGGTVTFNGGAVNTYTGGTTVTSGNLTLNFANLGSTANLINSSSPLSLGGGALQIVGNGSSVSSQTFAGATFISGASTISVAGAGGSPTLALGALTNTGQVGTVEFVGPATVNAAGSNVTATAAITTSSAGAGPLGLLTTSGGTAYATVGLFDWASTDTTGGGAGTTIIGGSQVSVFYTALTGGVGASNLNYNVTGATAADSTGSSFGGDTLRFNTNIATTFTVTGFKNWGVGGILVTPTVGAHNVTFTDNGGASDARGIDNGTATNHAIVQNNTSGELIFSDSVFNHMFNGSGSIIQSGAGTVVMTGTTSNAETGATYLNGGVTEIAGDNELGGTATSNVNLNGGTLVGDYTGYLDNGIAPASGASAHPVVLGSNGGGLGAISGNTFTVDGLVSGAGGTGALVIGVPASSANGATVGLLPGTGTGTANTTGVYANGTVVLSDASNSYTGGTLVESGTLQFAGSGSSASTAVFGTGAITLNGGAFQWASGNTTDISTLSGGFGVGSIGGTLDTNGNTVALANPVGNNGSGGFTVIGGGSLTMNGANTFTGPLTVGSGGVLSLGAANVYTGATTVNGSLTLKQGSSLANTAITVGNGGTLTSAPTGNGTITVGATGATLTLSAGSTLSLTALDADSSDTLTLNGVGTATGTVFSVGGTTAATLDFELGSNGSSELVINDGETAFGAQGGKISISDLDTNVPLGSYTLISDPNGGISTGTTPGADFSLANTTILVNGTTYVLSLANSNSTTLTLTVSSASLNYYFTGGSSSSWNNIAGNFATTHAGSTPQSGSLSNTSNVFLTADTATTYSNYTTETVDGNTTVNSLTFTGTDSAVGNTPAATAGIVLNSGTATAPLIINGANTFTDTNGNTYSNTGVVVQAGSAAQTINASIDLGATQAWEIDGTQLTMKGAIADAPSTTLDGLVKSGTGALILAAANTYDGGTTVKAGLLQLASGGSLASTGALTVQGTGTFDLAGNNQTVGVLSDGSVNTGTITSSSGTPSLTVTSGSFSGTISGSLSLAENGASTLTLTGSNSYTGTTTVSNGTLVSTNNYALGNSASATSGLVMSGTSIADFKSAAPSIGALTGASGNDIVLGNAAGGGSTTTLTITGAGAGAGTTFAGVISNASSTGYGNLTLNGGSLTLSGANTFTGTTLLTGGTLTVGTPLALQSSTVNIGGGTLSFGSQTTATLGALAGTGGLAAGTTNVTLGGNNTTNSYSGALTGSGALTVLGSGVQTFSNDNLTGNITAEGTAGDGLTISGGTFGSSGATLNIAVANGTAFDMTGGTATFGTVDVAIGAGQTNGGMIITGGNATFTNVEIGSGGSNTAAELLIDGAGASVALGNVSVQRDEDAGPLDDGLVVEAGTVTANQVLIQPGSAHSADIWVTGGSLTIGNSGSSGAFEVGDLGSVNANLTVSGGALTYLGTDGLLMNVTAVPSTATLSGGVTSLTGITLDDVNSATETSTLSVNDGATLYLGSVGLKEGSTPTVDSGASATLGTATIGALANWSTSVPLVLITGSTTTFQTADASSVGHNITLNGTVSGGGGLTATGGGILTLNGAATYNGATTVNGGTLIVAGGLTGSATTATVNTGGTLEVDSAFESGATIGVNGGTLDGTGSVGAVNSVGGTIAPGLSTGSTAVGILTAGAVSLDSASTFSIRLGVQTYTDSDQLVSTSFTLADTALQLTIGPALASYNGAVGNIYTIVDGGYTSGEFSYDGTPIADDQQIADGLYTFTVLYGADGNGGTAGNVELELASVPEPGTWASLLGGLGMLLVWQRSRRRRTA